MKNTTTKKASAKKKLLPAAGSLLISAAMLSTSTYAWFTMNKEVQVSGMEVHTKVSSNLLICGDNVEGNYSSDELIQVRKALLEPTSTVSGATGSFFYTLDAAADGKKIHDITGANADPYKPYSELTSDTTTGHTITALTTGAADLISTTSNSSRSSAGAGKGAFDATFNSAYGITGSATAAEGENAYGYVDYVFYLKATSDTNSQAINMTRCNLLYDDKAIGNTDSDPTKGDKAWRVAVFASKLADGKGGIGDSDAAVSPDNASTTNSKGILALENTGNQTSGQAVSDTNALGAVAYNPAGGIVIGTIANSGSTEYYKVTVRLWLEGEDKTCKSDTYAQLTDHWKLDLAFELGKGTPVSAIGSTEDAFNPA